jgi:hypothetical protein
VKRLHTVRACTPGLRRHSTPSRIRARAARKARRAATRTAPTDDESYKKESRLTVAQWHRRVTLARHVLLSSSLPRIAMRCFFNHVYPRP